MFALIFKCILLAQVEATPNRHTYIHHSFFGQAEVVCFPGGWICHTTWYDNGHVYVDKLLRCICSKQYLGDLWPPPSPPSFPPTPSLCWPKVEEYFKEYRLKRSSEKTKKVQYVRILFKG